KRCALPAIGAIFDTLMERLGYGRYVAQGGDWGSFVTAWLAAHRPDRVAAIHLNFVPLRRDAAMFANPTPAEARYVDELNL
ncbi:alpha/beta fold hydrolase, partial [Acinetobacter baumannii]